MRVHRFFISTPIVSHTDFRLEESDVIHQMRDVFRLKKGDAVHLLDNSGFEYETTITLLTRDEALFHITNKLNSSFVPKVHIHLYYALTKKDTFEWVLEKGTELGVSEFTPLIAERTEKKDINDERAKRIIREAAEQSSKTILPVLHPVMNFSEALKEGSNAIAFHLTGERFDRQHFSDQKEVAIFIGPEGGWSEKELMQFKEKNNSIVTLGSQVLRAETAALAVSTLFLLG